MSAGRYAAFDAYGFRHFTADLFDLELYDELYEHAASRDWFEAQTAFDPSRQTYADSLDWALRAAESDPQGLPLLLPFSLLRPTVNVLAAQVPTAVLEVLARLGRGQRAEAYAALRTDPASRCQALCCVAEARLQRGETADAQATLRRAEQLSGAIAEPAARTQALCRIAHILEQSGDPRGARAPLTQAERLVLAVQLPPLAGGRPSRASLLAQVATVAHEIGASDLCDRAVGGVRAALQDSRKKKPAAVVMAARKFGLLDRPEYLLPLVEWQANEQLHTGKNDALGVVARIAAAEGDAALLDRVLAEAHRQVKVLWNWQAEALVAALVRAGRIDDALTLIAAWRPHHDFEDVELREALAREAGRRGDLAAIERAASPTYSKSKAAPADARPDVAERLDRALVSAGRLARRTGWRLIGVRDWERASVLLAGVEGLQDAYPEQAQALWEQTKAESGWFLRRLAPTETERPGKLPGPLTAWLRLYTLAVRWDDGAADLLATLGRFDQAIKAAQKLEHEAQRSRALASVADAALEVGDVAQTLAVAEIIEDPTMRRRVVDRAASVLARQPPDEALSLLDPFLAQANRVERREALVHTPALAALLRETAQLGSVGEALRLAEPLGPDVTLVILPALGQVAAAQNDVEAAQALLARAERGERDSRRVGTALILARLAVHWAEAPAGEPARAAQWTALSQEAFRRAWDQTQHLEPKALQAWVWPWLARAARRLGDKKALSALHKQVKKLPDAQGPSGQALADQVLVQVILGLTSPDDYLGNALVAEIWYREFRAQAQAEMAARMRRLPPQKRLFWTRRSREDLDFEAGLLLDNVRQELTGAKRLAFPPLGTGRFRGTASLKLNLPSSSAPALDEHSIFARMGQESRARFEVVALKPSPEEQAWLAKSGREAVERAFVALAAAGRSDDIVEIVQQAPAPADQPLLAAAVAALARAGQVAPAQALLPRLNGPRHAAPALATLAGELASRDAPQARTLLEQALAATQQQSAPAPAPLSHQRAASPPPPLAVEAVQRNAALAQGAAWPATIPESAPRALAEALLRLPAPVRRDLLNKGLRAGRERGRGGALAAIAALAPVAASLLDAPRWREMVEMMIEMDTWFK